MKRKPISYSEAPARPWRICESRGGALYIYPKGDEQPIPLLKSKKTMTRKELATLKLICDSVNVAML